MSGGRVWDRRSWRGKGMGEELKRHLNAKERISELIQWVTGK